MTRVRAARQVPAAAAVVGRQPEALPAFGLGAGRPPGRAGDVHLARLPATDARLQPVRAAGPAGLQPRAGAALVNPTRHAVRGALGRQHRIWSGWIDGRRGGQDFLLCFVPERKWKRP